MRQNFSLTRRVGIGTKTKCLSENCSHARQSVVFSPFDVIIDRCFQIGSKVLIEMTCSVFGAASLGAKPVRSTSFKQSVAKNGNDRK